VRGWDGAGRYLEERPVFNVHELTWDSQMKKGQGRMSE